MIVLYSTLSGLTQLIGTWQIHLGLLFTMLLFVNPVDVEIADEQATGYQKILYTELY